MRITKKQLKRIIKEETKAIVDEGWWPFGKKEAEPESEPEPEPKPEPVRTRPEPAIGTSQLGKKVDVLVQGEGRVGGQLYREYVGRGNPGDGSGNVGPWDAGWGPWITRTETKSKWQLGSPSRTYIDFYTMGDEHFDRYSHAVEFWHKKDESSRSYLANIGKPRAGEGCSNTTRRDGGPGCEDDEKCENGVCVPKPFYARENKINKTDLQEIIKETIQEEKSFLLSAPKK